MPDGLVRGVDERIQRTVEGFMVPDSQDLSGSLSSELSRGGWSSGWRRAEPQMQVECSQVLALDRAEEVLASDSASYTECRVLCVVVGEPEFNPFGAPYGMSKEAWGRVLAELIRQGLFVGQKEQFIQNRVTELLRLHNGEGKFTHGLTEKSVSQYLSTIYICSSS